MAADQKGIPFTMSSVSVCPIEEVAPKLNRPIRAITRKAVQGINNLYWV